MIIEMKLEVIGTYYIGGNTPSSKNNRVWTGMYFVASKNTQQWRKKSKREWEDQRLHFMDLIFDLPRPLYIGMYFIRKSKHRFDYINLAQTVQDEMQYQGWIEEDDADSFKPYFRDYSYNKENPGCYIYVLKKLI